MTMSTITGVNPPYFLFPTPPQASGAGRAVGQVQPSDYVAASDGNSAPQATAVANALTGSSAARSLSSDVVGALLDDQAKQTSTNLVSAAPGAASTGTAAPSGSASSTLQQIADRYDIHHLTADQAAQLREELVKSGALSPDDARHLFIINATAGESFGHWDGHNLTGANKVTTPAAGSTFDEAQLVQTWLTSDRAFGNTQNASAEQDISNVLNSLDQLRASRTTNL
jgi:hypothetical protein